jgi:hypothetical protein
LGLHSGGAIRESGTGVSRIVLLGKVPNKLTSTVLDLGPKLVGGRGSYVVLCRMINKVLVNVICCGAYLFVMLVKMANVSSYSLELLTSLWLLSWCPLDFVGRVFDPCDDFLLELS